MRRCRCREPLPAADVLRRRKPGRRGESRRAELCSLHLRVRRHPPLVFIAGVVEFHGRRRARQERHAGRKAGCPVVAFGEGEEEEEEERGKGRVGLADGPLGDILPGCPVRWAVGLAPRRFALAWPALPLPQARTTRAAYFTNIPRTGTNTHT